MRKRTVEGPFTPQVMMLVKPFVAGPCVHYNGDSGRG